METTVTKEILLLDSTLGAGGELIGWKYGEEVIPNIRQLSLKSGLDIVELGLLCSYPQGPDCTIYASTLLPAGFEKQPGQRYTMLLDQKYWPKLSGIPERSSCTVDMIRVCLTPERQNEELEYCGALLQKGYHLVVLLDEIGQYTEEKLSALLRKVDVLQPWACCLYDTSGVLDEKNLNTFFYLCDKMLNPSIRIGFHGCDNLQCLFELAKAFCEMETNHGLCVDVSAGGIGTGALHLSANVFAKWMNDTFHREYDLPVLTFQETYIEQYLKPKQSLCAQLLYHVAAKHKCSYRYVEYYCELSVEPSDQLSIYQEITRESAFRFDKSAANRALLRYRKKRLNLVIVVPTANRWEAVYAFLLATTQSLLCYGVDIVIYDSSDDEKTYAVTRNFQIDGYDNIIYKRYTGESDDLAIDRKVLSAFREYLDYDYIWLCRDDAIPAIAKFYYDLVLLTGQGTEFIAVDWSYRNHDHCCVKKYDNCTDFFSENAERISTLGCAIFKSAFATKLLDNQPLSESTYGFWMSIAPFHQMAVESVSSGLIVSNAFVHNPGFSLPNSWFKSMLKIWGENWYRAISELPAVYDSAKASVLKIRTSDFQPFALRSMLKLRSQGYFNLSIYRQYHDILSHVSVTSPSKFYFAALIPKEFAKQILDIETYWTTHPNSFFSKLLNKLYHIYVRLGR